MHALPDRDKSSISRASMAATILIVEDERDLVDTLEFNLRREGFQTRRALTGSEGLALAGRNPVPDLVLLDLMLPDVSGTEVCRRLRMDDRTRGVPVVMLTAKDEEVDRIVGFEVGADDYVTKPFSVRELMLRVRAVLRRAKAEGALDDDEITSQRLRVDPAGHRVWVDEGEITLTALEFRLLSTLLTRAGRVQTRDTLLTDVWGMQTGVTTRTVDTHVTRLRKKLGPAGEYIETLRGVGYRFRAPTAHAAEA
jgi:two-component system phosphate regulon response regulator PhoB